VADNALSKDQQERQREERCQHSVCSQSYARHGQSLIRPASGKSFHSNPHIRFHYTSRLCSDPTRLSLDSCPRRQCRCETCAIDIGSLKATYLLTYLLKFI